MTPPLTRRRLLAGTGAAGTLALGWRIARPVPAFTQYTYARAPGGDSDDRRLRVAWYESYNGDTLAPSNGSTAVNGTAAPDTDGEPIFVEDASGPGIGIHDVLPGDAGSVIVGLLAESPTDSTEGTDVWFRPAITANDENRLTEPERLDPDEDGSNRGELATSLVVRFWLDDGPLGGCDARPGLGDPTLSSGTAGDAFDRLAGGELVAACLTPGDHRCIGFEWTLPAPVGNAAQTDSIGFELAFVGVPCGASNPFVGVDP